ncbi:MAG: M48 family metallopeptidase [Rubrivivax sp.]|nr:M48 family metallopeptidase [Rubrivivax sp.]
MSAPGRSQALIPGRFKRPGHTTALSRAGLAALAVAGLLVYHAIVLAPFALIALVNPWTRYFGPWPALVLVAVVWWVWRPVTVVPGRVVPRADAPALYAALDEMAGRLAARQVDEVRLLAEVNAAAMRVPVRWQPWRARQVLLLGEPLLAFLDEAAVRAVIAHELGHFSRHHGRLGHWLYRTRTAWLDLAGLGQGSRDEVSLLERGAAAFARVFAPWFARISFLHARRCEFEADADGAALVGPRAMATALATLEVLQQRLARWQREQLPRLLADLPEPPADHTARLREALQQGAVSDEDWARLEQAEPDEWDTHPSLAQRLQAHNVSPAEARAAVRVPAPRSAGAHWWRDWPAFEARHDARWREERTGAWRLQHPRRRHERLRWLALRAAGDVSIESARLALANGDSASAVRAGEALANDEAHAAEARFIVGAGRLALGQRAGLDDLEAAVAAAPGWACAGRALIAQHEHLLPGPAERRRNQALLERAAQRRAAAAAELLAGVPAADITALHLPEWVHAAVSEALRLPVVAAAWCAQRSVRHDGRVYEGNLLVLRLRTAQFMSERLTEEAFSRQAEDVLRALVPADRLVLAWTAFTTEPLPLPLQALLTRWVCEADRACLVVPDPAEPLAEGVRAALLG